MFYNRLCELCEERHIATTTFIESILHMSKGNVTKWRSGAIPKSDTISTIAAYFGVSTDYLLGNSDTKKEVPPSGGASQNPLIVEIGDMLDKATPAQQELALRLLRELLASRDQDTGK